MLKTASVLFVTLIMLCSSAALAEPVAVAYANYANSMPGTYQDSSLDDVDTVLHQNMYEISQETSSMKFHVNSPIGDVWVNFDDFSGDFSMLDNGDDRDVASIEVNAESMHTRRGMVGSLLKSAGFLDVANFPSMKFVGDSFEWFSDTQAILAGTITIKDTARKVAFYVKLKDSSETGKHSDRVTLEAIATIKRSDFGINTLLPLVSDEVKLYVSINAVKKKHKQSFSTANR